MDLVLIFALILVNGIFAMTELAVVAARSARLHTMADEGYPGAPAALRLHNEPSNFLSTIQVGITLIGVLLGAVGEDAFVDPLAAWFANLAWLAPYSDELALALVVIGITYLSVVVGELVPKRLALIAPERVASFTSKPMLWLAWLAKPVVWLFSTSSDLILLVIGAKGKQQQPVTDEEIKVLMEQGAAAGVFHASEQKIISNVLRLDEQLISAIMTARSDIYLIDLEDPEEEIRRRIAESPHSRIVVCRGGFDHIIGVLQLAELLKHILAGGELTVRDIKKATTRPLYVPRNASTTQLLENFRRSRLQLALVVSEYGDLQGLVTLRDIMTSIVGDLDVAESLEERDIVQRSDGSWLVDGSVSIERFKEALNLELEFPGEEEGSFHTVGGLAMHVLGRIPMIADRFGCGGLCFEVVDMDKNRVDKILVTGTTRFPENSVPLQ